MDTHEWTDGRWVILLKQNSVTDHSVWRNGSCLDHDEDCWPMVGEEVAAELFRLLARVRELESGLLVEEDRDSLKTHLLFRNLEKTKAALDASEQAGRQYCLELAEKASKIRRLESAIRTALGHVRAASRNVIDHLIGVSVSVEHNRVGAMVLGNLDRIREAFSAKWQAQEIETTGIQALGRLNAKLQNRVDSLLALLSDLEWSGAYGTCPECDHMEDHSPDCRLSAALHANAEPQIEAAPVPRHVAEAWREYAMDWSRRNSDLSNLLASLEWKGDRGRCPSCGHSIWDRHAPDCALSAALRGAAGQPVPEQAQAGIGPEAGEETASAGIRHLLLRAPSGQPVGCIGYPLADRLWPTLRNEMRVEAVDPAKCPYCHP